MSTKPMLLFTCDVCGINEAGASLPPVWGETTDEKDKTFYMCGGCITSWNTFLGARRQQVAQKAKPAPKGKR